MIRLTTRDASILARVVQYENLPIERRRQMLDEAGPEAQRIGRVLLKLEQPNSEEVREIVAAIENWVGGNRQHHKNVTRNKQRSSHASYRYA
jgi:hypothetical protein